MWVYLHMYVFVSLDHVLWLVAVLRFLHHGVLSGGRGDIHLQPQTSGGEEVQGEDAGAEEREVHRETLQCRHHQGLFTSQSYVWHYSAHQPKKQRERECMCKPLVPGNCLIVYTWCTGLRHGAGVWPLPTIRKSRSNSHLVYWRMFPVKYVHLRSSTASALSEADVYIWPM